MSGRNTPTLQLIEKDFTREQRQDFSVRKEILFESDDENKINKKESEFIRQYKSNELIIGYNHWPKNREFYCKCK